MVYVGVRFRCPVDLINYGAAGRALRAAIAVALLHEQEFVEFVKGNNGIYRRIVRSDKFVSVTTRISDVVYEYVLRRFQNLKFKSASEMFTLMLYFSMSKHQDEFVDVLWAIS